MKHIELSSDQHMAIRLAEKWYNGGSPKTPIFRLAGYAGTGKTTTIHSLVERLDLDALFAAYTGKAALVMQRHGVPASTIHSLIYRVRRPDKDYCLELTENIKQAKNAAARKKLKEELREAQKPTFVLNEESALCSAELLALDECSMVNDPVLEDLLWFGVPIIAIGDPGQLPPIEGAGALFREDPNITLTEIHRQAEGNPIIDMSIRARNGIPIPQYSEGKARHISRRELTSKAVLDSSQILVGKNATRREINKKMRLLHGFSGIYPEVGEKLICLRNNAELGLYNGLLASVLGVGKMLASSIELKIQVETLDKPLTVRALRAYFEEYEDEGALEAVHWWERTDIEEFDFGYALTVHKAQGSQWDSVILIDDGFLAWNRKERRRWLYTAITRAADTFILAD